MENERLVMKDLSSEVMKLTIESVLDSYDRELAACFEDVIQGIKSVHIDGSSCGSGAAEARMRAVRLLRELGMTRVADMYKEGRIR